MPSQVLEARFFMPAFSLFNPQGDYGIDVPHVVRARLAHLESRVAKNDFSAGNLLNHRTYLTRFAQAFPIPVEDCTQQNFEAWIERNPQWASGHTLKTVVSVVLSCFKWAANPRKGGLIDRCPFEAIEWITNIPYKPRRAATAEEFVALMRKGAIALQQGLFFIHGTGCRPCEMRQLLLPWAKLDAPSPHLFLEWHKTIRKSGKPKVLGLSDEMVLFLRNLISKRLSDPRISGRCRCDLPIHHDMADHVFTNCDGLPWVRRSLCQNLSRCAIRAGLDNGVIKRVSAGCFRTKFVCDLIEAGFTNREIADLVGHTSTDMVDDVYGAETRERAGHLDNLANRVAKLQRD